MEKEIRITNELDEITVLADFVEELCSNLSLPAEITMHINLALEEAVSNVIMYAYPQEEHHEIRLKASLTDNQLIFLLTDKGFLFDPTNASYADITIPIEERSIGGLGIFLIRSIMNEVSYQRLDGENRLTMKKNLELG
ncbi:ATP-binding protein [Bacteroides oleiciplenus]|uniref:ATP-binding protein n=1 Tax=Bacteroides oleiciplenus TaxID=626931 RepID=A0A3E5B1E3_9BACE|nr:ATP-binding protein [Bacteroides oleiciplenus]RGN31407.1 ATP-binding protein [Bacteroides oleiciplenus]